jgi:CheY-like chemotaxis protein
MLRTWFTLHRYPHQIVGNGAVALQVLQAAASAGGPFPQVIILDVNMPVMDGCTFIEQARATYPRIPIVVYTASMDASQEERLIEARAERILLKTRTGIKELLAVVDQLGTGGMGPESTN